MTNNHNSFSNKLIEFHIIHSLDITSINSLINLEFSFGVYLSFNHPNITVFNNNCDFYTLIIKEDEFYLLLLTDRLLNKISSNLTNFSCFIPKKQKINILKFNAFEKQIIINTLNKLEYQENIRGFGYDLYYRALITEILIYLGQLDSDHLSLCNLNQLQIESIKDYIDHNFQSNLSLNSLSIKFFLSKHHLSREFKRHVGINLHNYIVRRRLIKAVQLLCEGYSISSFYKQCGFNNYSNFFKAFKKEYNCTPKEYLHKIKLRE